MIMQTKRVGSRTVKEGWVFHFTNKDNMMKKHYWRLDSKSITMFKVWTLVTNNGSLTVVSVE